MKARNQIFVLLGLLLLSQGCEKIEKIENFPLEPSRLVVNALFESNENEDIALDLSKSLVVIDNAPHPETIEGAKVTLYKEGELIGTYTNYPYRTGEIPEPGATYKIEVEAPKYSKVSAETTVPQKAEIKNAFFDAYDYEVDSFEFGPSMSKSIQIRDAKMGIDIIDKGGVDNYYMVELKVLETYGSDSSKLDTSESNFYSETSGLTLGEQVGSRIFFSDAQFDGRTGKLELTVRNAYFWFNVEDGETVGISGIRIVVRSLSYDSYQYYKSLYQFQIARDNPFADPVQVYNNIEGGYGIFAGEHKVTTDVSLPF